MVLFFLFINGFGLTPRFIFLFFPIIIPFAAYGLFLLGDFISDKTSRVSRQSFSIAFLSLYVIGNNVIWLFASSLRNNLGLSTEDLWG